MKLKTMAEKVTATEYYGKPLVGVSYKIKEIRTVGDMKRALLKIIEDLPDDEVRISELYFSRSDGISITFGDYVGVGDSIEETKEL